MLLEACAQSERSWNPFRPPTADTVATVPPCVLGCLAELGEDADASLAAADVGSVLVELPTVVSAATAAARLGRKVATVLVFSPSPGAKLGIFCTLLWTADFSAGLRVWYFHRRRVVFWHL